MSPVVSAAGAMDSAFFHRDDDGHVCVQVLYLGLVQFMNVRGGELLPPPPEAFDHAFD